MATFIIPGKPQGKARVRVRRDGHAYTPENTTMYENLVKLSYIQQCGNSIADGPLKMDILAAYPIPKSFTKKERLQVLRGELHPTKKPDADNIGKIVADALNGVAYRDDSQIILLRIRKTYSEEPRVVVTVCPL